MKQNSSAKRFLNGAFCRAQMFDLIFMNVIIKNTRDKKKNEQK